MESVCSFALHDANDPTLSEESPLEDGGFVYFTLPIDKRYSTFFVIGNAAGTRTISGTPFSEIHTCTYRQVKINDEGSMCYIPPAFIVLWYICVCASFCIMHVQRSHISAVMYTAFCLVR